MELFAPVGHKLSVCIDGYMITGKRKGSGKKIITPCIISLYYIQIGAKVAFLLPMICQLR